MTDTHPSAPPQLPHFAYVEGCGCPNCRAHRNYLASGRTSEAQAVEIFTAVLNDVPGAECIVLVVDRAHTGGNFIRDTFPLSADAAARLVDGLLEAIKVFNDLYTVKIVPPAQIPAQAGAREIEELPA